MRLLTRAGCHLCDDAREVIGRVCASEGVEWYAEDVDAVAGLADQYKDHVPVVFVDGELHRYWFVDEDQFRQALSGAPKH